jgi:hypothetical protein
MGSAVTIHVQCAYPSGSPSKMNLSPVFSGVHIFVSVECYMSIIVYPFFFWPLCCLSFFYLRHLITPLVPSNLSLISPYWYLQTFLWFPPIGTFKPFFDFPLLVPSNLSLISPYWYLQTFLWFPTIGTFKPFFDFPLLVPSNLSLISPFKKALLAW